MLQVWGGGGGGLIFGGECTWKEFEYYFYSLIREFIHLTPQDKHYLPSITAFGSKV